MTTALLATSNASGVFRNPNLAFDQTPLVLGHTVTAESAVGWQRNLVLNRAAGISDSWLRELGARWWTGVNPELPDAPGIVAGKLTMLPSPDLSLGVTRDEALRLFQNMWLATEIMFSSLHCVESFYRPPYHNQRHPMIFYWIHPAALYINKFRVAGLLSAPLDARFEALFETGVDSMSWDCLNKNEEVWPTIEECINYRRRVYETVVGVISGQLDPTARTVITPDTALWTVFLSIAHESIHLETSSVLLREMPLPLLRRPHYWPALPSSYIALTAAASLGSADPAPRAGTDYQPMSFVPVAGGTVAMGRGREAPRVFGWDNEFGEVDVDVPPFHVSNTVVTNGEFYEFVRSGAYQDREWWSADGWAARCFQNAKWPAFWVPIGPQGYNDYALRLIFEIVCMPWDAPALITWHEADAFARWQSSRMRPPVPVRLITEAEHRVLRDYLIASVPSPTRAQLASLDPLLSYSPLVTPPAQQQHNHNLFFGSESPVTLSPSLILPSSSTPLFGVIGNVWQWCLDYFAPFPGFKTHPSYPDFSVPCFDNAHYLIVGGSFISTNNETSHWARFHFRPFLNQHAGVRLVYSDSTFVPTMAALLHRKAEAEQAAKRLKEGEVGGARQYDYESSADLARYIALHFNHPDEAASLTSQLLATAAAPSTHVLHPSLSVSFSRRIADVVLAQARLHCVTPPLTVFDDGCAVGGVCIELASADDVGSCVGMDLSQSFVTAAARLAAGQELHYELVSEGSTVDRYSYTVPAALAAAAGRKCTFVVGDACNLPPSVSAAGPYSVIIMCNLLCRLPSPRAGLLQAARQLVDGGLLLIMTPCSWGAAFTPESEWLGGHTDSVGAVVQTVDGIGRVLGPSFSRVLLDSLPLVIRLHRRKFELILSELSVWRKRL